MGLHVLHEDVVLRVTREEQAPVADLDRLLDDLSFVRIGTAPSGLPTISLRVRRAVRPQVIPAGGRLHAPSRGLRVLEFPARGCVSDGSSALDVQLGRASAVATLTETFAARPCELRQRFWAFGVMKLLRARGFFGLHAAAVTTPSGLNLLIVGPSGCGKSTMAIQVIRRGGLYLSDDAVLLRASGNEVECLALRKPFSIDAARTGDFVDLLRAAGPPPASRKRRVDVEPAYPRQRVTRFRPQALVFPSIVGGARSALRPVRGEDAMRHLLAQSAPELFDRRTMPAHLRVLSRLVCRAPGLEMRAGRDVYESPAALEGLLDRIGGEAAWPGSSSN